MKKLLIALIAFTPFFCLSVSPAGASQVEAYSELEELLAGSTEYAQAPSAPQPELPTASPDPLEPQPEPVASPDPSLELQPALPVSQPAPPVSQPEPAETSSKSPNPDIYALPLTGAAIEASSDIAEGDASSEVDVAEEPAPSGVLLFAGDAINAEKDRQADQLATANDPITNPGGSDLEPEVQDPITNPGGSAPIAQDPQPAPSYSAVPVSFPSPAYQPASQSALQDPREVVNLARQEDAQIVRGISVAVEQAIAEGNIQPVRQTDTKEDSEKLVYKVELEDISFLCGEDGDVPATVAKLKGQDELIVVLWDSEFFSKAGYDPQTRCNQASARFADFAKEDLSIAYMTSGKLNDQSVICLTNSKDGDCGSGIPLHEGLLFTLKPKENPDSKLKQLASLFQAEPENESKSSTREGEEKTPASTEKAEESEPLKE